VLPKQEKNWRYSDKKQKVSTYAPKCASPFQLIAKAVGVRDILLTFIAL